jgi:hypothetical protein
MTTLAQLGVRVTGRTFQTTRASVGQIDVSSSVTTRFDLELPRPTALEVGMRKESWATRS